MLNNIHILFKTAGDCINQLPPGTTQCPALPHLTVFQALADMFCEVLNCLHSLLGFRLGTSWVSIRHDFLGCKSQFSSGTSTGLNTSVLAGYNGTHATTSWCARLGHTFQTISLICYNTVLVYRLCIQLFL